MTHILATPHIEHGWMPPMQTATKELKLALKAKPDTWVRTFRDGTIWVGLSGHQTHARMLCVRDFLTRHGYCSECNGKPGTSGEFIIDVTGRLA